MSERDQRVEKLTQALLFALLTANEQPYPLPVPVAKRVAEMMDDCGVRQTDSHAELTLPGWITQRAREEAAPVPDRVDHHAVQDTPRVGKAPKQPKKIPPELLGKAREVLP